ncbi:hypothetical protein [Mycobacterium sp. NPDC006124]|uniref:hypothetical protein n=1 Tax=Mycobacterium sp. NPDC006124 TaxID=3156729 RepID=UPI0033B542BA
MTHASKVVILADHSALLAIPAFAPAILVVAVVIWVARRDRRLAEDEDAEDERTHSGSTGLADEDGAK